MDNKNPKKKITSVFETLAIADEEKRLKDSKVNIPSQEAVKEGKDWVDFNEK